MSGRAIVLGITPDYAFGAGALIASILAHDPKFDATIIIQHDGLDEAERAAFIRLWPRCQFRVFGRAEIDAMLGVGPNDARVAKFLTDYSPLVLAKLDLPLFLDDFDQVLWLDADILVRGPLEALWEFDCLAWRPLPAGAFARREKALSAFGELDLDPDVPLLNGGVIGVSRGFIERGGSRELLHALVRQLVDRAPSTQIDEMPWYLAAASLHMPVTRLPMAYNHPVGAAGVAAAIIVHAIGQHKFWNATPLTQLFPDWQKHQARWEACGGRPYSGHMQLADVHPADASEVLRAAQARSYWLEIFAHLREVLAKGMVVDLKHDQKHLRIFLHGRPVTEHLRLVRQSNERRMGLEPHLPDDLADRVVEMLCRAAKGARHEKGRLVSLPFEQIGAALSLVDKVLEEG